MVELSVICLTYNSDINKLLTTLNSVINQKNCNFEIIIADDGSEDNNFEEVVSFFASNNFGDYELVPNVVNQGIIKNYLSAIKLAKGKYIKYISPGDYLYDEYTLEYICEFMHKYDAKIAFGKAVYYSGDATKLNIFKKMSPVITKIYDSNLKNYDYRKVLKHIMVYGDSILGAAVVADKNMFKQYLKIIENKVIYIEDNTILPLLTLDGERIYFIDRYILWYEYKSGISTSGNKEFSKKIKKDFFNCYQHIITKHSNDYMLKIAYMKIRLEIAENKWMLSCFKRLFIDLFYGKLLYKIDRHVAESRIDVTDVNKENYFMWNAFERNL